MKELFMITAHDNISTCWYMQTGQVCISQSQITGFVEKWWNEIHCCPAKTVHVEIMHAEVVLAETEERWNGFCYPLQANATDEIWNQNLQ